jgi:hypothetical protein
VLPINVCKIFRPRLEDVELFFAKFHMSTATRGSVYLIGMILAVYFDDMKAAVERSLVLVF